MARVIGCEGLHIAKLLTDTKEGATWEKPIAVPSLIAIDIKDNSEKVELYSDDKLEQVITAMTGKEVTIELGGIEKDVLALISGNTYEEGVFIQSADAVANEVALMFKAPLSRGGFRYCALYKGVLAQEETNYKTKEGSVEGQTIKLTGVFMALENGVPYIEVDDNDKNLTPAQKAMVNSWFTKVPVFEKTTEKAPQEKEDKGPQKEKSEKTVEGSVGK